MTGLCKVLAAAVISAAAVTPALGQANPGGGGPGGNPQQFRQRMEDRLKADLGVTDDEWKALQPRVEKVMELQRASFVRGFGRRGRGGNGGDPNQSLAPSTPVQAKAQDLQKVLDNKDAKPEEIKAALQALRDVRTQAREDLTKAQSDLRDLLTTRQESVLVMAGLLE